MKRTCVSVPAPSIDVVGRVVERRLQHERRPGRPAGGIRLDIEGEQGAMAGCERRRRQGDRRRPDQGGHGPGGEDRSIGDPAAAQGGHASYSLAAAPGNPGRMNACDSYPPRAPRTYRAIRQPRPMCGESPPRRARRSAAESYDRRVTIGTPESTLDHGSAPDRSGRPQMRHRSRSVGLVRDGTGSRTRPGCCEPEVTARTRRRAGQEEAPARSGPGLRCVVAGVDQKFAANVRTRWSFL